MLGLGDFWVSSVFILLILSTLLCVVYGAINWNKGGDDDVPAEKEKEWVQEEKEIESNM